MGIVSFDVPRIAIQACVMNSREKKSRPSCMRLSITFGYDGISFLSAASDEIVWCGLGVYCSVLVELSCLNILIAFIRRYRYSMFDLHEIV